MPKLEMMLSQELLGWRLQRRADYSRLRGHLWRIAAVLVALLLAGIAIQAGGQSALDMARNVGQATLGSAYGWQQLLILATPLILTGAAFLIGIRMQLFNFGLEGRLYMGAFAATAVGLYLPAPAWLAVPLMLVVGAAAGAAFALIPALMRAYTGTSEILTTLLLNPLAIQWAAYIGMSAWRDTTSLAGATSNATASLPYELPGLWGDLQIGIVLAVLAVIGLWLAFANTSWGYEVISIGANRNAARYGGMSVVRNMLLVMLMSGGLAGLAGVTELLSVAHRFSGQPLVELRLVRDRRGHPVRRRAAGSAALGAIPGADPQRRNGSPGGGPVAGPRPGLDRPDLVACRDR